MPTSMPQPNADDSFVTLADAPGPALLIFKADATPWPARPRELAVLQWAEVAGLESEPAGFYLGRGLKGSDADALLDRIRRSQWWYLPVLTPTGKAVPLLADAAADLADALEICDAAAATRRELGLKTSGLPLAERILYFLQIRENAEIHPERDRRHKLLYRYPLAEALASTHDDVSTCLATLQRRGLVEAGVVVDRTRHCRRCNSAHIHFLEVCPLCEGLDIRETAVLPCFDCGYVAPESDFLRRDGLLCPRCGAAEQHIGVTDGAPLMQHVCASCKSSFAKVEVQSHCLDCANIAGPLDLDIREIAPLRLTAAGSSFLRTGSRQQPLAVFETLNAVLPRDFLHKVDWALAARARDAKADFGLLLIALHDTALLMDGSPLAGRLIVGVAELARQLSDVIRMSDISTRINGEQLWFYLPFSDVLGARRRVDALLARPEFKELVAELRIDVRSMQLPERRGDSADAQTLMKRLGG